MAEKHLQFDLEQGIMSCWNVTSDLEVLFEELVENDNFTRDDASNFVLGLQRIYESKFDKTFRTFEAFLKEYYNMRNQVKQYEEDLAHMRAELREFQDQKYSRHFVEDEGYFQFNDDEDESI